MRFTFIVDISNLNKTWANFEKRTKYAIKKCKKEVFVTQDILSFDKLHQITRPDRRITSEQIKAIYKSWQPNCKIYSTGTAMAVISWNDRKGYYLLAAREPKTNDGSPSKILWQAIQDLNKLGIKEFDLCGANVESIAFFKRGFGGCLTEQIKPCIEY